MAKAVLPTLPIAGRVTTADALHTHAEFMQVIHDQRGRCVLTVKKNQPTLYADLATYFADPHASCQRAETWDRCRGRVEHRVIRVSTELNAYLTPQWPHVAQVAEVTRAVTKKGETSTEVVYLITDLSPQQASPLRLLVLMRGHWGIEIVQSQMTKTNLLTALGGGDHVTDLHLISRDNDPINQQLNHLSFLLKGRFC